MFMEKKARLSLKSCNLKNKLSSGIINRFPAYTNLRHLELCVFLSYGNFFFRWTPLIEASPVLQKLTVKFIGGDRKCYMKRDEHCSRPLRCLKMMEVIGFLGHCVDIEFVTYVLENAVILEKVMLRIITQNPHQTRSLYKRALQLERKLPQGAKLVLM